MFSKALLTSALFASLSVAQTDQMKADHPDLAESLGIWKYDWMMHDVVTEDGYHLGLLEITAEGGRIRNGYADDNYSPVLTVQEPGISPYFSLGRAFAGEDLLKPV